MSNCYYDETGVLVLGKVTPVIRALFSAFDLDEAAAEEPGLAAIYNISESNCPSWELVGDGLIAHAKSLGHDVGADPHDALRALAAHFGAAQHADITAAIDGRVFDNDNDAHLPTLFRIAVALDDGHGLTAVKTNGASHSDRPFVFAFGGYGEYTGRHCQVSMRSFRALTLGEAVDKALAVGNTAAAAGEIGTVVRDFLAGISDPGKRAAVAAALSEAVAEEVPQ